MSIGTIFCLILLSDFLLVNSQLPSSLNPEQNPPFEIQFCEIGKGCQKVPGSITLDATWRTLKDKSGKKDCFNGKWEPTLYPDPITCSKNCALGDSGEGSRIYLLDAKDNYQMFYLLNKEFTFDVDVSQSLCGVTTAIYFSSMLPDGEKSDTNQAGAKYGTGYCDAQGPKSLQFVQGKANMQGKGGGLGNIGYACPELDVWEANAISQAFTPHNCRSIKAELCEGENCRGMCDGAGCDFASFRMGNTSFYGPSKIVDTTKKFTVITQFITSDGTDQGELVGIKRFYKQKGRLISNSKVNFPNVTPFDSITDQFCNTLQPIINRTEVFQKNGGLRSMGEAMRRGMVLIFSIWVDKVGGMDWLDGDFSNDINRNKPGKVRGTCAPDVGKLANINKLNPETAVEFSAIKVGPIGSTFAP